MTNTRQSKATVLITGAATGLGELAARELIERGHHVVLHARTHQRLADVPDLTRQAASVVVGDLADMSETEALAAQIERLGPVDAVIHNAGIYTGAERRDLLAVNVVAPYLLTALTPRPGRLIYLSSDMHRSGNPSANGFGWSGHDRGVQAYRDSKLYLTVLAMALARRWPDTVVNAVDPGWVPTRMGGPDAPDDLELGHRTQTWLAVSNQPAARTSGGYWHHQQRQPPAAVTLDHAFQQALLDDLARITGVPLG